MDILTTLRVRVAALIFAAIIAPSSVNAEVGSPLTTEYLLDNGLKVVVREDHRAARVGVVGDEPPLAAALAPHRDHRLARAFRRAAADREAIHEAVVERFEMVTR